jgi:hypothetical protein
MKAILPIIPGIFLFLGEFDDGTAETAESNEIAEFSF